VGTASYPRDIPPFWFLVAIGGELVLHFLLPGARLLRAPWTAGGIALNALGLWLMAAALARFRRARTGVRPFSDATALIADGPYRFTRNPMYLGMVTMLLGGACVLGTATPWLLPPCFAVLIDRRFIRREEGFMAERFGDEYRNFCRRVRRWL
jgi:protein-S-isoprenylcysteine O-methyltransferase Ste14